MDTGRNYKAEYQSRNTLARERGFTGYWQERRSPRRPCGVR